MEVNIIIEIPKKSFVKYEISKDSLIPTLKVDRILKIPYPFNYGFIENTMWDDGDPLDAIVLSRQELSPLTTVILSPIAVIKMFDNGVSDYKIVFSLDGSKFEDDLKLDTLTFLKTYKDGVEIKGIGDKQEAEKEIKKALQNA